MVYEAKRPERIYARYQRYVERRSALALPRSCSTIPRGYISDVETEKAARLRFKIEANLRGRAVQLSPLAERFFTLVKTKNEDLANSRARSLYGTSLVTRLREPSEKRGKRPNPSDGCMESKKVQRAAYGI